VSNVAFYVVRKLRSAVGVLDRSALNFITTLHLAKMISISTALGLGRNSPEFLLVKAVDRRQNLIEWDDI
jgi:hypothetical protein